jgi:beta-glucosidase
VPSHANRWLLEDVLRLSGLPRKSSLATTSPSSSSSASIMSAADKADAARQALQAGVDMELPDPDGYRPWSR